MTPLSSSRRSPLRSLAFTAMSGLVGFSAAPAADPAARTASPAISDVVLARSALSAIDADPALRDANLLVSVVDRVAVIGGPVPTLDHGKRAEAIVRRVNGIVEVKNRCFVQDVPDPLLRAMSARPAATKSTELPGVVPSPKTGLVEEFSPALGSNSLAAVEPSEKSVVARRPANPGDSVLLPPVGNSRPATPKSNAAPAASGVLAGRTADALAAAESLRKADRRYEKLTVTFTNGTFVIAGAAARASDAWDLADQLRRIPGVPRVALGSLDVK